MANFYDKKAGQLWLLRQSAVNVPKVAADFASTDAIAGFDFTFGITNTQETIEFSDNISNREQFTGITDRTCEVSNTTYFPGFSDYAGLTGSTAATEANFYLERLFDIAGCTITYAASATHDITITGTIGASDTLATALQSASTPQTPTVQKLFRFYNARALVDLELELNKRSKLKWMIKGIPVELLEPAEDFPETQTTVVADFGVQKTGFAPIFRAPMVQQAEFAVWGSKAYNTGADDLPTPFAGTVKNFCISKLSAANLFGYTLERLSTTCGDEFNLVTVNPDLVITIMEPEVGTTGYSEPDAVLSHSTATGAMLEQFYAFALQWGTVAGKKYYIAWDKLQCVDSKPVEVAGKRGRDLTFKNNGQVTIKFR